MSRARSHQPLTARPISTAWSRERPRRTACPARLTELTALPARLTELTACPATLTELTTCPARPTELIGWLRRRRNESRALAGGAAYPGLPAPALAHDRRAVSLLPIVLGIRCAGHFQIRHTARACPGR